MCRLIPLSKYSASVQVVDENAENSTKESPESGVGHESCSPVYGNDFVAVYEEDVAYMSPVYGNITVHSADVSPPYSPARLFNDSCV